MKIIILSIIISIFAIFATISVSAIDVTGSFISSSGEETFTWHSSSFGGSVSVTSNEPSISWHTESFGGSVSVTLEENVITWHSSSFGGSVSVEEAEAWGEWSAWWKMYQSEISNISISNFNISHINRHCVDWINFTVDLINATEVYINFSCPDTTEYTINITENNTGNKYWCNTTFDNGETPGLHTYGWPQYGNGSYTAKIYAINELNTNESETLTFYIYPNADVTMNNLTNAIDSAHVAINDWGDSGSSRFSIDDTNGNGVINALDISYITYRDSWGWTGDI